MKKNYLMIAGMAMCAVVFLTSCGGTKPTSVTDKSAMMKNLNEVAEEEIIVPCHGVEFFSTGELIRSNGIGESMDQQMAKRMSRQAALEDLGTKIGVSVNALIIDYYKSNKQDLTEDLKRRFEGGTDIVVKERISGYRTACEKFTKHRETKNWKCYIVIELGANDMAKAIHKKLSDDQILRIDYDFEKFRAKFNEEMAKQDQNK
jgi:hypothetical protein